MAKPKADPSSIYPILVILNLVVLVVNVWLGHTQYAVIAGAAAIAFISLQLGAIYHQYAGITRLIQILNGLIVASLKAQGYEMEGTPSAEEEST